MYCPMSRQSMNAMGTGRPQSIGRVVTMCGVETSELDGLTRCGMYEEKEFGHIKRYCPKLDRRPKVVHAEETSDHGRMVTPSGVGTSGVDDPVRALTRWWRLEVCARSLTRLVVWGQCRLRESGIPFEKGIDVYSVKRHERIDMGYGVSHSLKFESATRIHNPYVAPTIHLDRNFQGSKPPTVPTGEVFTPMCNKCGRLHYGSTCPGSGNGCFHYKELGHIKRFCPKLDRRLNVIHVERARDHG
ncbi:hypothetical protein Lal_00039902 [Lupinus albus]|nr:hypothetical protein Lal_00039902 [Lupinus albus]